MRTHIIQLEPHDGIGSAREKMTWGKLPRTLLVWPAYGVHPDRLDLVLLKRHSRSLGSQLGLVSRSLHIRAAARDAGIPVFRTVEAAQHGSWRFRRVKEPGPPRERRSVDWRDLRPARRGKKHGVIDRPGIRAALFTAGVLAVLAQAVLVITVLK